MASSSRSPQCFRNDAERIVEITTFTDNGLQELQQPLLCQDEGDRDISMEHKQESRDVENPYTPLASSIKEKLDLVPTFSSGNRHCIYRVPKKIRQNQEAAFTPQVVSIGPLHYGNENLKAMEEHKQKYLKEFLERTDVCMEDFVAIVKQNEVQLRGCYAETIGMDSDQFVEMILVDATFIIELLLKDKYKDFDDREFMNDRIFNKPRMIDDVKVDMLMLENQIPFFILEKLYDVAKIASTLNVSQLFYECFTQFYSGQFNEDPNGDSKLVHFLDYIITAYQPVQQPSKLEKNFSIDFDTKKKLTITELDRAGVKFEAPDLRSNTMSDSKSKTMFDIKFQDGILQIPKIILGGGTDVLLRNLIAFEKCHFDTNSLSDYAILLDSLIDTEKDVEILIRNEVLAFWSSDYARAVNMFNSLSSSLLFDPGYFYYGKLLKELDDYCKVPWHKWNTILQRNYLNTPWAIISLMGVVILLILTAIQTVWSITHP